MLAVVSQAQRQGRSGLGGALMIYLDRVLLRYKTGFRCGGLDVVSSQASKMPPPVSPVEQAVLGHRAAARPAEHLIDGCGVENTMAPAWSRAFQVDEVCVLHNTLKDPSLIPSVDTRCRGIREGRSRIPLAIQRPVR